MRIGDLVRFRSSYPDWPVGIVVEEFHLNSVAVAEPYSELRVQWLDDDDKDVSWVRRKDLEVISPASPRTWK